MEFKITTKRELDLVDITDIMQDFVSKSGLKDGILFLFLPHATAALITLENESGLVDDFKKAISELIPEGVGYRHDRIDNNAHSHIRASLLGADLFVPISNGELVLGTWQQIFLVELDTRARTRRLYAKILTR